MAENSEVLKILKLIFFVGLGLSYAFIAVAQFRRMIAALKKEYIDWILTSWWLLYWISMTFLVFLCIIACIPYEPSTDLITLIACLYNVLLGFWLWSWFMISLYPTLLNVYISKLSYLKQGQGFFEVKRAINFWEKSLIIIIVAIWVLYITLFTIFMILTNFRNWIEDIYENETHQITQKCEMLFLINYTREWVDLAIAFFLFVLQFFMYRRLVRIMNKRHHYFYQLNKKSIHLLYRSSITCFFFRILFYLFYVVVKEDRLIGYTGKSSLTFYKEVIQFAVIILVGVSQVIFCFLSTRYINFALYVSAWMIGYNVDKKFHKMSIFIRPSWFYQERDEEREDSRTLDYAANLSDYDDESTTDRLESS